MAKNYVYVSSWLDDIKKDDGGIHLFEQDENTGKLKHIEDYAEELSVGFFCISPDKKCLYALDEIKRKPNEILCGGSVHAFSIDGGSGKLTYINSISTAGIFPCYIAIDSEGRHLFIANYGSEDVTVTTERDENGEYILKYKFDEASAVVVKTGSDGKLDRVIDLVQLKGVPSKAYEYFQSSPHPHSININPSNELVLVTDRGCDELLMYKFNSNSGKLELADVLKTKIGTGPRNSIFHPVIPCFYVLSELMPYVAVYKYEPETGKMCEVSSITTVPDHQIPANFDNFFDDAHPADICIHPNLKFLYVSNRGVDSIAIFSINESDGSLCQVGYTQSGGMWPWACKCDGYGKYFYVGNKKSDNLEAFCIKNKTGELQELNLDIKVERPVCIKTLMFT